ncbi:TonB-dependent receptor plug domain-containing protein [Marinicauda sp. Alg238-R41]|uniref:TonB-dependent receptor plug domain-containing protein n=1 Tax=Marinicauda sp. Alg238-R41 TaxID=2993447 RepID=UPI0022E5A42B|nr:TonB-dependent receptor [Marinicauda sp. Alg238-R41]
MKSVFYTALLSAVFTTPAYSQTAETSDTIIVTGTRLDTPASETGTAVTVIGEAELERTAFALDAIATAPGVTVNQNGAFGGAATVRIRGAASEQTLVLIDSVPVNDPTSPGGGYDFASLDTAQIERIEVLRGAQSTLWGTDAIGGVVNIVTKRAAPGLGVTGFAETGSFGTVRGGAAIEGGFEQGDFRLGASAVSSDGISKADEADGNTEDDGYDAVTLAGRGRYELGFGELAATVRYVDSETEFDSYGAVTGTQDGDEVSKTTQLSGALTFTNIAFAGALETMIQVAAADIDRESFTNGVSSFGSQGERQVYRYQGTWNLTEDHRLAFGAEREDSSAGGDSSTIDGLFVLLELQPLDGLVLTGGVRHDEADRFGAETTGKLAASWQLTDQVRLRGTAGTGFKAPTLFQTTYVCCGATEPNADLRAETSEGFDVGVEYTLAGGRAAVEATYFDQTVENQIGFSFAVGGYENIARVDTKGVELAARFAITEAWSLAGNYTYIEAEDGQGGELIRLPEHSAYGELAYDGGRWGGALSVRHNGEEQDSLGPVDAWTRLDASARYDLTNRMQLYVRGENLTDEQYQQVFGYGTPGLSGYFGVRLTR